MVRTEDSNMGKTEDSNMGKKEDSSMAQGAQEASNSVGLPEDVVEAGQAETWAIPIAQEVVAAMRKREANTRSTLALEGAKKATLAPPRNLTGALADSTSLVRAKISHRLTKIVDFSVFN